MILIRLIAMIQHIVLKFNLGINRACLLAASQLRRSGPARQGFTLIELLVVISIIGLLASIVVVSLGGARRGSRDVRAAADLRQIQIASELYYDSQSPNTYINAPDVWTDLTDAAAAALHPYMDPVPTTNGVVTYEWCDNGSPSGTYRLRIDL